MQIHMALCRFPLTPQWKQMTERYRVNTKDLVLCWRILVHSTEVTFPPPTSRPVGRRLGGSVVNAEQGTLGISCQMKHVERHREREMCICTPQCVLLTRYSVTKVGSDLRVLMCCMLCGSQSTLPLR